MRAFLLAPIALIAAVSAGHLERRSPFHAISSLVARSQVIDPDIIPDECKSACSGTVSDLNSCTTDDCLCTNENGQQLEQCISCLVNVGDSEAATSSGQSTLDTFVSECNAAGKPIDSLTLGGNSGSTSNSNTVDGNSSNGSRTSTSNTSTSTSSTSTSTSTSSNSNSNNNSNGSSSSSSSNSNSDTGATLHLVTDGGVLVAALIGAVAYLC